ncbi:PP2C family protein-serine/threonine phosphatase [Streptomyces sp. NPDC006285]|uniref:PP2C family protein-serine/threonine phosphatase n=1 Tax=Streptomyces sp. NPDC006285 TaxID=3364742 RepID=UPI0036BF895E
MRRSRRAGHGIADQAIEADRAMREHGRPGYVTDQLLRISLIDCRTEFVDAGHPWPLRMRDGQVRELTPKVDVPFGLPTPHTYQAQSLDPQQGDRLVMLTDDMLERNANSLNPAEPIVRTRALPPRESARTLIGAIVDVNEGRLQDDATVMCLDWHGVGAPRRDADTGADLADASAASRTGPTRPSG